LGALRLPALIAATAAAAVATTATAPAHVAAAPAATNPTELWRSHIEEASRRFGVPAQWIERVMIAESGGRTIWHGRPIVSHAGAMGLMQLMPATWAEMRRRLGLGRDPHVPRDNILAGTLYLRLMYDRFGYPGLFGAYNAGPTRYAAYLEGRRSLPGETRDYLRKVAGTGPSPPRRGALQSAVLAVRPNSPEPEIHAAEAELFFIRR
jgi:soluble lytic murein transglycosylase-like protein